MINVWVTLVEHRYGTDILGVFKTRERAYARLEEWVDDNWDSEIGDTIPKPSDRQEKIHAYFDHLSDEGAIVEEAEFDPDP